MSLAQRLIQVFGGKPESDLHPHVPEERAGLYTSCDDGSTEIEVLNAIHALVYLFKPQLVLETGTYLGIGTAALATGLRDNGFGALQTIEMKRSCIETAKLNVSKFDPELMKLITFIEGNSLDFIARYQGPPFNFVFFDSQLNLRYTEFYHLYAAGKLAPGAVCLFHDTSRYRGQYDGYWSPEVIELLDKAGESFEHFEFPFSRGMRFLRLP